MFPVVRDECAQGIGCVWVIGNGDARRASLHRFKKEMSESP
jgi:hypothetical protein